MARKGAITPRLTRLIRYHKAELLQLVDVTRQAEYADTRTIQPLRERSGSLPGLTQQRLWYLASLAPESAVYNLPSAFQLRGKLNLDALQGAINEIVRRHDVLRTALVVEDHEPRQRIQEDLELPLEHIDLTNIATLEERCAAMYEWIDAAKDEPIPMDRAPMVRAALLKLESDRHVLFWMPHHVIWDGWSFDTFLSELDSIYNAYRRGADSPLPNLQIQYADFASWHRDWASGPDVQQHLHFWRKHLGGDLPVLELPTDRPRPEIMSFRGARTQLSIEESVIDALSDIARDEGATLFMVLLAAFYALLYRYTGQTDLIVGTPVQARMSDETQDLLGVFVNTLVLRGKLSPGMSFRELVRNVRDLCLSCYDYQETPFELLVDEFEQERTLSRNPLYQVLFSYQDVTNRGSNIGDLDLEQIHVETSVAPTDMTVWLMETGKGLTGGIDYATDLFDPQTAQRFASHYETLLLHVSESPGVPIARCGLLPPEEQDWIDRVARGPVRRITSCTVDELIHRAVTSDSDAIAVVDGDTTVTYGDLWETSGAIATGLRDKGVKPGDCVGVCVSRRWEMVATLLAVLRSGAAYVPLDPTLPSERIGFMIDDADLRLIVVDEAASPALAPLEDPVASITLDRLIQSGQATLEEFERAMESRAYLIYTSGTTGRPKGVAVGHRSVVNMLESMKQLTGFRSEDAMLAVTTIGFDISVLEVFLPLISGGRIILATSADTADARRLARLIEESKPTHVQATPAMWRMLKDTGWSGPRLHTAISGGEDLPADLASWIAGRSHHLLNVYGPTETTVWSTLDRVAPNASPTIGTPIHNTRTYVLDADLNSVPIGVPGDLYIAGDGLALGYHDRPDLTAERFLADPHASGERMYATGDRARWRPDGKIEFLGRLDNQVKLRGFRIELGEIEGALRGLPGISNAAVALGDAADGDKQLIAHIVVDSDADVTPTELRRALRHTLPDYMIPSAYIETEALPLTPSGKIDRRALNDIQSRTAPRTREFVAPGTATERVIAGIWKDLLGKDRIGVHDNFFELGGQSLMGMRVVAHIEEKTGIAVNARELFFRNLGQLAELLDEKQLSATP